MACPHQFEDIVADMNEALKIFLQHDIDFFLHEMILRHSAYRPQTLDSPLQQKRLLRRRYRSTSQPKIKTELNDITRQKHKIILNHRLDRLDFDIKEALNKNNVANHKAL